MHYLTQAAEGGLDAKTARNWSNSGLIDVKNPPSSWIEKQCPYEMLHIGVFFYVSLSLSLFFQMLHFAITAAICKSTVPLMKTMRPIISDGRADKQGKQKCRVKITSLQRCPQSGMRRNNTVYYNQ